MRIKEKLVIIGAGAVGREVAWIIQELERYEIVGFIDENKEKGTTIDEIEVLGNLEVFKKSNFIGNVIIAISNSEVKERIVNLLSGMKIEYPTIVAKDIKIHDSTKLGEGTIIYRNVNISVENKIGKHCIISSNSLIGHNNIIEDYVCLHWNSIVSGNNRIEKGSLLKSGSIIMQGVEYENIINR